MFWSKENGRNKRWWYKRGGRKAGSTLHQLFIDEISIRFLLLYIPQPRSQVVNLNNSKLAH